LADPRPAKEIGLHTGLAEPTVHNLISPYNRLGPDIVEGPGKGGRRRRQVSKDFPDNFIVMLVDQAGWHTSKKLAIPENIRLIKLPPRSPELNSSEHIWEELRQKHFPNIAFKTLDAVEKTLCQGLNALSSNPAKHRSLTNFPYLIFTH
jgi:hypothetical protein